jgi:hypothetical protein
MPPSAFIPATGQIYLWPHTFRYKSLVKFPLKQVNLTYLRAHNKNQLHHATVTAGRWEGSASRWSSCTYRARRNTVARSSAPVTTHTHKVVARQTQRFTSHSKHMPVLNYWLYKALVCTDPAWSSGTLFLSRIWTKQTQIKFTSSLTANIH